MFVGEARNIDRNVEQGGLNYQRQFQVLTFRVDCRDSAGQLQESVPVRLRGQRIVGNVKEGEQVEVRGWPGRDGVVRVGSFWNVATQSRVAAPGLLNLTRGSLGRRRGGSPPVVGTALESRGSGASLSAGVAARVGQFASLIGVIVFAVSVTMLTSYVNNGTGGRSLLQATHGDLASPLYPTDFWTLIALVGLVFVATIASGVNRRLFMIVAALASAGLVAYTLHIPHIGRLPGFAPYGSAYWISLLAAAVMALGAAVAAAAR